MVKVAIMQPYFFPYLGYFQLMSAVDVFVVYDNIQYTKKGWINRNRMLLNGEDSMFSLPLKKDSDLLNIRERAIATDFNAKKFIAQLGGAYRKAPYFRETIALVDTVMHAETKNLFDFLLHSLIKTTAHLGIHTPIKISSAIPVDHTLKSQSKVIAICKALDAGTYINAIGGKALYTADAFSEENIALRFIQSRPYVYQQFGAPFIVWLSIIDVLMFNSTDAARAAIESGYALIT